MYGTPSCGATARLRGAQGEHGLADAGVRWAVLPPGSPLAAAMRHDPTWRAWGSDAAAIAFRRAPR